MQTSRISGLKHFVIYLVIVALIGVGGWALYRSKSGSQQQSAAQSHQIFGQIKSLTDTQIAISGVYLSDTNPAATDYKNRQDMTIQYDSNTKFTKTVWHMPSKTSLSKSKNQFDPNTIQKEQQLGTIAELKNVTGMPITVTTPNVTGDKTIYAQEISYNTYLYAQ